MRSLTMAPVSPPAVLHGGALGSARCSPEAHWKACNKDHCVKCFCIGCLEAGCDIQNLSSGPEGRFQTAGDTLRSIKRLKYKFGVLGEGNAGPIAFMLLPISGSGVRMILGRWRQSPALKQRRSASLAKLEAWKTASIDSLAINTHSSSYIYIHFTIA